MKAELEKKEESVDSLVEEAISSEPVAKKPERKKRAKPENNIMITTCPQTKMWTFQYEKGGRVPPEFRQKFIRRADAERHIRQYAT